jgi:hypothetical protein
MWDLSKAERVAIQAVARVGRLYSHIIDIKPRVAQVTCRISNFDLIHEYLRMIVGNVQIAHPKARPIVSMVTFLRWALRTARTIIH